MKKLIIILIALSFVSVCLAASIQDMHRAVIARRNAAAPAGAVDYTADATCQGAWLFASGLELLDETSNDNDLTNNGTTTFASTTLPDGFSTGQYGIFNGTDQYLSRANASMPADFPGYADNPDMTVSVWVYFDIVDTGEESIIAAYAGNQGWQLSDHYGSFRFRIEDSTPTSTYQNIASESTEDWLHVVLSVDGDGGTGQAAITAWISTDGGSFGDIVDGTSWDLVGIDDTGTSGADFKIGSGDNGFMDGNIYQPIVFNRTFERAEALELYTTGIKGLD